MELSDYDVEVNLVNVPFREVEEIIRDFAKQPYVEDYKNYEKRENNIHDIPINGFWDDSESLVLGASLVLDYNKNKLYSRIGQLGCGIRLEDAVLHRDRFNVGFFDFLRSQGIMVRTKDLSKTL